MYKRYLTLAFRHLFKDRLFSVIKIVGLTIGVASGILVALYIHHELSYDSQHLLGDRIVKANMEYRFGGESVTANVTGNKVATAFSADFPEIESAVRAIKQAQVVKYQDRLIEEPNLYFADSTFFSIFTFPLIAGQKTSQLSHPDQVVLSASTAKRYFGTENPLGKQIRIGATKEFIVSGVMADPPQNTHLKPDLVASFAALPTPDPETWWSANYATYFLIHEKVDLARLQAKIPAYMQTKSAETGSTGDSYLGFQLERFKDIHLHSAVPGNFEPAGDIKYIYILAIVGFLILLIACITYINLTTAASTERAKSIGVQKVLGISKSHLITQSLLESCLITSVAIFLGFILANTMMPWFNVLFDRQINVSALLNPLVILLILSGGVVLSLLAGTYPAFIITKYQPVKTLRGQLSAGKENQWLRKSLITFQFCISIVLTISALTLYSQMKFIQSKKIGFDKDQVVSLPADRQIVENYNALKTEMLAVSGVSSVTISYDTPIEIKGGYDVGLDASGQSNRPVTALPAGLDFIETMDMQILAGKDFNQNDLENSENQERDSLLPPVIINETLAASWGLSSENAIGRIINFNSNRSVIKGVVNDFHFASLHQPIEPLVIFPKTYGRFILVKLKGLQINKVLDQLNDAWTSIVTHRPFTYNFLDSQYQEMYRFESQNARVTYVFTWLAIFLACLGLFGIATYGFAQRKKEIGIRKVLGSGIIGIFGLLAREYLILVSMAFFLASPLAYFAMTKWLNQFAYGVEMSWWMFALAGFMAFIIALLTLSYQGIKAALLNPMESLRSE